MFVGRTRLRLFVIPAPQILHLEGNWGPPPTQEPATKASRTAHPPRTPGGQDSGFKEPQIWTVGQERFRKLTDR